MRFLKVFFILGTFGLAVPPVSASEAPAPSAEACFYLNFNDFLPLLFDVASERLLFNDSFLQDVSMPPEAKEAFLPFCSLTKRELAPTLRASWDYVEAVAPLSLEMKDHVEARVSALLSSLPHLTQPFIRPLLCAACSVFFASCFEGAISELSNARSSLIAEAWLRCGRGDLTREDFMALKETINRICDGSSIFYLTMFSPIDSGRQQIAGPADLLSGDSGRLPLTPESCRAAWARLYPKQEEYLSRRAKILALNVGAAAEQIAATLSEGRVSSTGFFGLRSRLSCYSRTPYCVNILSLLWKAEAEKGKTLAEDWRRSCDVNLSLAAKAWDFAFSFSVQYRISNFRVTKSIFEMFFAVNQITSLPDWLSDPSRICRIRESIQKELQLHVERGDFGTEVSEHLWREIENIIGTSAADHVLASGGGASSEGAQD